MNLPAIFVKTMPLSLPITIGLTLNAAALITAVSMSGTAHAQTAPEGSITSGLSLSMSAQIRYAETSIERQPPVGKGEPAKSGAGKKNSQRLDRRQEMNREEKAGGSSSTDRNQGSQRKIRRALA
jgi:hypothetical protein